MSKRYKKKMREVKKLEWVEIKKKRERKWRKVNTKPASWSPFPRTSRGASTRNTENK